MHDPFGTGPPDAVPPGRWGADPALTDLDADGDLVLLADQDRTGWDRARIREGIALVGEGLRRTPAVAVGERDGPTAGLTLVEALSAADGALAGYPLAHAARAELLARLGRADEAAAGYLAALALGTNAATRRHLERRLLELRGRSA